MPLNINELKAEINKQFRLTPESVHGVSYGYKRVAGQRTSTLAVVFEVDKKKPRAELKPEEMLPEHIMVGGERIPTDVREKGRAVPLNACYNARDNAQLSSEIARLRGEPEALLPMRGGQEISMFPDNWGIYGGNVMGTLGFFAIDNIDDRIVGVTNTHVVVPNLFFAGDPKRFIETPDPEPFDDHPGYPNYYPETYPEVHNPINTIEPRFWSVDGLKYPMGCLIPDGAAGMTYHPAGRYVKRYVPYSTEFMNYADAALLIMDDQRHLPSGKYFVDENSYRVWTPTGVPDTGYLPFATTQEIDTLLTSLPADTKLRVYSTGRTTGPKGYCETYAASHLILTNIAGEKTLGNLLDPLGVFDDLLFFEPRDPDNPAFVSILGGDSGSALLADIGGQRKIIGIVFAGPTGADEGKEGYACRIDKVVEALNIRAWDETYVFDRATSLSIPRPVLVTKPIDTDGELLSVTHEGELYWHAGVTSRRDISASTPTDITTVPAVPATLADNVVGGALVYVFSTVDADAADTFVYSLVPGLGDDDNDSFYIVANQLRVNLTAGEFFDATVQNEYSVRVRSTDSAGAFVEKVFVIQIVQAPKFEPTDILLSNDSIEVNNAVDALIGTFSAVDADGEIDSFTYDLVNGVGSENNNSFTISGNSLLAAQTFFSATTLSIRVRVTDSVGLTTEKAFTITVTPEPLAPTFSFESTSSIDSTVIPLYGGANDVVGTFVLSTIDPDSTPSDISFSLVPGNNSRHNNLFIVTGTELRTINNLTFPALEPQEGDASVYLEVRVRATDTRTGKYTEYSLIDLLISATAPSSPAPFFTANAASVYLYADAAAEVGVLEATVDGIALAADDSSYELITYAPDPSLSLSNALFTVAQRPDGTWILRTVSNLLYSQTVSAGGTFNCTVRATHLATGMTTIHHLSIQPTFPSAISDVLPYLNYAGVEYYLSEGSAPTIYISESSPGVIDANSLTSTTGDYVVIFGAQIYGTLKFELFSSGDTRDDSNSLFSLPAPSAAPATPTPQTLQNITALTPANAATTDGYHYYYNLYVRVSNYNENMTDFDYQPTQFMPVVFAVPFSST